MERRGVAGREATGDRDEKTVEEVVPHRAVLTELARGFLLVHESNPERARRFAETFLKERALGTLPLRMDTPANVPKGRLSLGRYPRGAVEPLPSRLPR